MIDSKPDCPRYLENRIREAMTDTPVVLVNGPRQAGKTTLVRKLAGEGRPYLTLDDRSTLLAAQQDPDGLIRNRKALVIDEVQRAPGLLLAIKKSVDEDRQPGRFLLTGSANLLTLPIVADSLAGRMETLTLLPLAGCEMRSVEGRWLDAVFANDIPTVTQAEVGDGLVQRVIRGGYPEVLARGTQRRRTAWIRQYVDAIIQRDVRELAAIHKLDQMTKLLGTLAHTAGRLCNYIELGGQVGLDAKTASKYLVIFEQLFLVRRLQPWSRNSLSRIVKAPRLQFLDSGLLASLMGLQEPLELPQRTLFGRVLESFVYGELLKLATWAEGEYSISSFRDKDQVEVDFVIGNAAGRIMGVEVKAAASVTASDLAGLRRLANLAGADWQAGVVLYDGTETLPLGPDLWAVPLSTLWCA
jgi:predicted AAA+ superfamily ATPase